MFCTECGAEINDRVFICPKCGVPVVPKATAVPSHLLGAILITLFCGPGAVCGFVAIIYATQVHPLLGIEDVAGAQKASARAKGWIVAGVIVGLLFVGGVVLTAVLKAT